MKGFVKKVIKNNLKYFGFRLLNEENYKRLLGATHLDIPHSKNGLLNNFFQLLKKQGFQPRTIYDIGANKGTWSRECMKTFPDAEYYLFEPQEELLPEVHRIMKDIGNYQVFEVGVGNRNESMIFTIHKRDDSCSYFYSAEEAAERGFKQLALPMVRLEDFVREKGLKYPSIIKIDAEGLDLEVLEGAGSLLSHAEVILVEVGVMNKKIPNSSLRVLENMDSKGFRLFDITDLNRPFPNRVLWLCEFVFIKKNGILDKNYAN